MAGKRADTLLALMRPIEHYTLSRAGQNLTDDEFFWEPGPTTWSIRRADQGLTQHPVFTSAAAAVTALREGWQRLRAAIERADDDQLEVTAAGYTYAAEPPRGGLCVAGPPGPAHPATHFIAGTLHEVSHHGARIGALRDLYAWRQAGEG